MAEEKYDVEGWGKPEERPLQPPDLHKTIMEIQKSIDTIPQHTSEIPPLKKNDKPVERTKSMWVDGERKVVDRTVEPKVESRGTAKTEYPKDTRDGRISYDRRIQKLLKKQEERK